MEFKMGHSCPLEQYAMKVMAHGPLFFDDLSLRNGWNGDFHLLVIARGYGFSMPFTPQLERPWTAQAGPDRGRDARDGSVEAARSQSEIWGELGAGRVVPKWKCWEFNVKNVGCTVLSFIPSNLGGIYYLINHEETPRFFQIWKAN